MTIQEALKWGKAQLRKAGVNSPALDAEIFLMQALHSTVRQKRRMSKELDRAWLYAHRELYQRINTLKQYKKLIAWRVKREPVAYILGHKEFYGLDFLVNRNVLIPRPETEVLVEKALEEILRSTLHDSRLTIIDVGTGSGSIAVALAHQCKMKDAKCKIIGTDVSSAAIQVAKENARQHGVAKRIKFLRGNLLEPFLRSTYYRLPTENLVIVANLPYLPTNEWRKTAPEIKKWEPRGALDGGRDGLKYYREMFEQLSPHVTRYNLQATLFCEICPHQVAPFKRMVRTHFKKAKFEVIKDLSGRARVVKVRA